MLCNNDAVVLCECYGGRTSDERLHSKCNEGKRKWNDVRDRKQSEIGILISISKAKRTSISWI